MPLKQWTMDKEKARQIILRIRSETSFGAPNIIKELTDNPEKWGWEFSNIPNVSTILSIMDDARVLIKRPGSRRPKGVLGINYYQELSVGDSLIITTPSKKVKITVKESETLVEDVDG